MGSQPSVELRVNDTSYLDIKRVSITRAIDQLADECSISMSDLWATQRPPLSFPIHCGDQFELCVDGETWLAGIITTKTIGGTRDDHGVELQGMSWAVNLTTSSRSLKPRVWREQPLDRIITDIIKPYGLTLYAFGVDLGDPLRKFKVEVGETCHEAIRRAAERRGLWVTGDLRGDIILSQAGSEVRMNHMIVGNGVPGLVPNVLESHLDESYLDRHDEIIVVGQSGERADWTGDQATHGYASAHDYGVDIYRPLVISEPSESSMGSLQRRANWEVRRRAGQARKYRCVVNGYLAEHELPGPIAWAANVRVPVKDGWCDVDGELLIERVTTEITRDGSKTSLDLVAPEAYALLAPAPRKKVPTVRRKGDALRWGA